MTSQLEGSYPFTYISWGLPPNIDYALIYNNLFQPEIIGRRPTLNVNYELLFDFLMRKNTQWILASNEPNLRLLIIIAIILQFHGT